MRRIARRPDAPRRRADHECPGTDAQHGAGCLSEPSQTEVHRVRRSLVAGDDRVVELTPPCCGTHPTDFVREDQRSAGPHGSGDSLTTVHQRSIQRKRRIPRSCFWVVEVFRESEETGHAGHCDCLASRIGWGEVQSITPRRTKRQRLPDGLSDRILTQLALLHLERRRPRLFSLCGTCRLRRDAGVFVAHWRLPRIVKADYKQNEG